VRAEGRAAALVGERPPGDSPLVLTLPVPVAHEHAGEVGLTHNLHWDGVELRMEPLVWDPCDSAVELFIDADGLEELARAALAMRDRLVGREVLLAALEEGRGDA
jgi:hypothetical protein